VQATASSTKFWALLVSCARPGEESMHATAAYMYHVLSEHYDFDGIYYIHSEEDFPGVNVTAHGTIALNETINAIYANATGWLYNTSGPNDVIFIFFNTHGGGYYSNGGGGPPKYISHSENMGARSDTNGDEDDDNYDECLGFYNQTTHEFAKYWDDDLAADIDKLSGNYSKLVLATQSCFGGGLIHDIQTKPRSESRVILTATSETLTAYLDLDYFKDPSEEDGYAEWSEGFIDALHGNNTYWNMSQREVVHQNGTLDDGKVRPDWNNDGHVTIQEAYNYARARDDGRNATLLEKIIDDPNPLLPNYSVPEEPQIDNGLLAGRIWFPKNGEYILTVQARLVDETELTGVEFWVDNDTTTFNTPRMINVTIGNHTIEMEDSLIDGNYEYHFQYWNYGNSSDNPLTVNILEHITLTAYYDKVFIGDGHHYGNVNYPGSYYSWAYIDLGYGIDLQVNQTDTDLINLALGSFANGSWGVGENLYNPDANLNGDELVDMRDLRVASYNLGTSFDEDWDGYKYEKKTTKETIYFYNTTNFEEDPLGQEKYEDGEKVFDDYYIADWDPVWAFQIANSTQGSKYFEEGWFCFDP
jgi:hypothetical protein